MGKREELLRRAREYNLRVGVYGPGDGVIRYRFAIDHTVGRDRREVLEGDYFAMSRPLFTALGYKEAYRFVLHFGAGYEQGVMDALREGL